MSDEQRGVDCTGIQWAVVDGHRWHLWKEQWRHYPHHCAGCRASIIAAHPAHAIANDTRRHLDCDGHLQIWTGAAYAHEATGCPQCADPVDLAASAFTPGRSPKES